MYFIYCFSEKFDESTIESILDAILALMQIETPVIKAKVLMLIAEIAKSGKWNGVSGMCPVQVDKLHVHMYGFKLHMSEK